MMQRQARVGLEPLSQLFPATARQRDVARRHCDKQMTIAAGTVCIYSQIVFTSVPRLRRRPRSAAHRKGSHARPDGADARRAFASATRLSSCVSFKASTPAIGATLAFILGSAVLAPSLARRERLWLNAGDASALQGRRAAGGHAARGAAGRRQRGRRSPRRLPRALRRAGAGARFDLHAPRLPHALQCRSSADRVPCHGGVYDVHGQVVAGPPPPPLVDCRRASMAIDVLVQV